MRRTIAEARSLLESTVLPNANPYWTERYQRALAEAETRARETANQRAEADAASISEAICDAQRELTEVRDELEALAADGAEGRIDAATYSRRMREATDRERRATADLTRLEERVEALATLEADPLGWYDGMARRFPSMKVDVPW